MRVLAACSLGGAGHLQPLLPLLAAAERRGDEVQVIAPASMQEMVETAGYRFVVGAEPPEADVAPIRERLPVAPPQEASVLGNRELFGRMATTAMLPAMERIVADWSPDFVLREPCEYASAVVAGQRSIRTAQVAISVAEAELGSILTAAPALEAHRVGLVEELRASPYLTRFPAALDRSPFSDTRRFREPESTGVAEALPDWWEESDAPLAYVTFGTVLGHMSMAADAFRTVVRAVADLPVRVLLTVGRTIDLGSIGPIPAHVHVEPWVDQRRVFGTADLVVSHGGSGTSFGALAAGVPLVVVPMFADQFENARRIAAAGAGVVVDSEPDPIARAITTVLDTPSFRTGARRIAADMAAAPAVDDLYAQLFT
jgi:UDP:flavonoid glycosyltransferase YjiC (YdhE family)